MSDFSLNCRPVAAPRAKFARFSPGRLVSAENSGSSTETTPARPTALGSDKVTPIFVGRWNQQRSASFYNGTARHEAPRTPNQQRSASAGHASAGF
jgi:hypothetical protein